MTKPKTKTPEHFAASRDAIERRRASTVAALETAMATVATHQTALAVLDADLVSIAELERAAAEIARRYSGVPPAARGKDTASAKKRSTKSGPHKLYTPAEEAMIAAAGRGTLKQLAKDIGHSYSGVQKKHEELTSTAKRPLNGPAYTPEEDERIEGVARGQLKQLAIDMGRSYDRVQRRHSFLAKQRLDTVLAAKAASILESVPDSELVAGLEEEATVHSVEAELTIPVEPTEIDPQPDREPKPRLPPLRARPAPVPQQPPIPPERVDPAHVGRTLTGGTLDNGPLDRRIHEHPDAYTWRGRE